MLKYCHWILANKFWWSFNHFFFQENGFENSVCEMVAMLSRPQCIKRNQFTWKCSDIIFPLPPYIYTPICLHSLDIGIHIPCSTHTLNEDQSRGKNAGLLPVLDKHHERANRIQRKCPKAVHILSFIQSSPLNNNPFHKFNISSSYCYHICMNLYITETAHSCEWMDSRLSPQRLLHSIISLSISSEYQIFKSLAVYYSFT